MCEITHSRLRCPHFPMCCAMVHHLSIYTKQNLQRIKIALDMYAQRSQQARTQQPLSLCFKCFKWLEPNRTGADKGLSNCGVLLVCHCALGNQYAICSPCRAHADGVVKYVDPASSSNTLQKILNLGIIPCSNLQAAVGAMKGRWCKLWASSCMPNHKLHATPSNTLVEDEQAQHVHMAALKAVVRRSLPRRCSSSRCPRARAAAPTENRCHEG